MTRFKHDRNHAYTGLPNIDRMRKRIERDSPPGNPDANDSQKVVDSLRFASAEELLLSYEAHELGDLAADIPQALELLQRYFIGTLGDGRWQRVYFRTGNTLGTGFPSVRPQDEIWFLHGAFAPVILRPIANGSYRFMGEAYVHGVMYGEAGVRMKIHKLITVE